MWNCVSKRLRDAALCIALAGCATSAEEVQTACDSYGFTRGTSEYASCVQSHLQADAARRARIAAAGAAAGQQIQQGSPPPPANTGCSRWVNQAGTWVCTGY